MTTIHPYDAMYTDYVLQSIIKKNQIHFNINFIIFLQNLLQRKVDSKLLGDQGNNEYL